MTETPIRLERGGYVARGASLADVPAIAAVVQAAFDRWPAVEIDCSAVEHVEWKMTSPGTPAGHHTVVTADDQVVCLKLRWVGRARIDGAEYVTDTGADFAADLAYRGRGLGRLLTDFEEGGARSRGDLAMDLPPSNDVVREHLHAEDIRSQWLTVWTRPLGLRSTLATLRRQPLALAGAVSRSAGARFRPRGGPRDVEVRSIDHFDAGADRLWQAARDSVDFARIRDAAYLNWRYADPRSGRREILGAFVDDELLGWTVLRLTNTSAQLIDVLLAPRRLDVGAALLASTIDRARELQAHSLDAWLAPGSQYEPVLRRAGFAAGSDPIRYEFFAPRGGSTTAELIDRLGDPNLSTHVTMGDFDFN